MMAIRYCPSGIFLPKCGIVRDAAPLPALLWHQRRLTGERDSQYWAFTRLAKGQPVRPETTRELADVEDAINSAYSRAYWASVLKESPA